MARAAASQVVRKIRSRTDGSDAPGDVTLEYTLIVRDSTAPAR
jgi:DNA-binding LacI/PurR family transcriptional regulator